jgi:hypothetical protein
MKLFITSVISLLATSAMACPQFNGTYACHGDGIDQTIQLKTQVVNGVTQYSMDDAQVLADGVYRKVSYMGGQYDIAATCKDQTASINIVLDGGVGDNAECGADKWNLLYTLNWTPAGNNISEVHFSSTVCGNGKVVPSNEKGTMTCVKK